MKLFFRKMKEEEPEVPRCTHCCNNCPIHALKCDHGRRLLGLPCSDGGAEGETNGQSR